MIFLLLDDKRKILVNQRLKDNPLRTCKLYYHYIRDQHFIKKGGRGVGLERKRAQIKCGEK